MAGEAYRVDAGRSISAPLALCDFVDHRKERVVARLYAVFGVRLARPEV